MYAIYALILFLICHFHVVSSKVIDVVEPFDAIRTQSNLLMAHAIIRHGDRNLYYTCPTDPWKDPKYWPEGLGQLTNIGKRQVFELGQLLANRYSSLFPSGYSFDTVKVYSSECDRTMMSAAACLAGLFPPTEQQIWNSNLAWHPIPINMLAGNIDTKIHNTFNKCKLREKLHKEYLNSAEVQQFLQSYQNTLDYVTANCGESVSANCVESVSVDMVHDSLTVEMIKNRTIPAWASEVYNDLERLTLFLYESYTASPQLSRLRIGFLIKEIFDSFTEKSQGNEKKNFILFFGHDSTIMHILNSLGIFDHTLPSYAACVVFELYENNGEFYVQIIYKNGNEFTELSIPDCGSKCPLWKIIDKYQAILPENDYQTECKNKE